jgi:excisionase family DNA binding protein
MTAQGVRLPDAMCQEVIMSETSADPLGGKLFADVPETAAFLRYDQRTVRRAIEAGDIPAIKVGERWRIPTRWLREQAGISAQ